MWVPVIFLPFAYPLFLPLALSGFLLYILRSLFVYPGPGELNPRILKDFACVHFSSTTADSELNSCLFLCPATCICKTV